MDTVPRTDDNILFRIGRMEIRHEETIPIPGSTELQMKTFPIEYVISVPVRRIWRQYIRITLAKQTLEIVSKLMTVTTIQVELTSLRV